MPAAMDAGLAVLTGKPCRGSEIGICDKEQNVYVIRSNYFGPLAGRGTVRLRGKRARASQTDPEDRDPFDGAVEGGRITDPW